MLKVRVIFYLTHFLPFLGYFYHFPIFLDVIFRIIICISRFLMHILVISLCIPYKIFKIHFLVFFFFLWDQEVLNQIFQLTEKNHFFSYFFYRNFYPKYARASSLLNMHAWASIFFTFLLFLLYLKFFSILKNRK